MHMTWEYPKRPQGVRIHRGVSAPSLFIIWLQRCFALPRAARCAILCRSMPASSRFARSQHSQALSSFSASTSGPSGAALGKTAPGQFRGLSKPPKLLKPHRTCAHESHCLVLGLLLGLTSRTRRVRCLQPALWVFISNREYS